jgi:hypothetical protein
MQVGLIYFYVTLVMIGVWGWNMQLLNSPLTLNFNEIITTANEFINKSWFSPTQILFGLWYCQQPATRSSYDPRRNNQNIYFVFYITFYVNYCLQWWLHVRIQFFFYVLMTINYLKPAVYSISQSQWLRGPKRGSVAARLFWLWVRILPGACLSVVSVVCC